MEAPTLSSRRERAATACREAFRRARDAWPAGFFGLFSEDAAGAGSVAGTLLGSAILQRAVELSDRGLAGLHRLGAMAAEVVRRGLQLGDGALQRGDGARDARMLAALLAGAGAGRGESERQHHETEDHEQLGDVALHTLSLSFPMFGLGLTVRFGFVSRRAGAA